MKTRLCTFSERPTEDAKLTYMVPWEPNRMYLYPMKSKEDALSWGQMFVKGAKSLKLCSFMDLIKILSFNAFLFIPLAQE